ncbi:MAG: MBL fold metallo-hydrolase [Acidobacteria bacterium]|nr:MBL fold metallo-hydrolase [Acidobacteriota bacterium]
MFVRFWGVRGSTPTPTARNLRYGGNTPCIELRTGGGNLFILDCGTGFRQFGQALQKEFGTKPIKARIFLTHYHWDHIQGIPFFTPLYHQRNQFIFHSYEFLDESVQQALEEQMTDPYFPVDMSTMRAHRHFFRIEEERIAYDDLTLISKRLNHPQGCLGYRIECDGKVLVYATDNEPGDRKGDRNVRRLADGADVLIYDAQYTPEEMKHFRRWGHSNWKEGVRIATECKAKRLVLFHHDPDRDDRSVDKILKRTRDRFDDVVAAHEGMVLKI